MTGGAAAYRPSRLERGWYAVSRWAAPLGMTLAYVLLAVTSDTDLVGWAWMGVGLGFVFVVWFVFRALTETAALSRALDVGDVARLRQLAARHERRARRPIDRARFVVGRALAHLVAGEAEAALATLDAATLAAAAPDPALRGFAEVIAMTARLTLGRGLDGGEMATTAPGQRSVGGGDPAGSAGGARGEARGIDRQTHGSSGGAGDAGVAGYGSSARPRDATRGDGNERAHPRATDPRAIALDRLIGALRAWHGGALDDADRGFVQVIDDVRAGSVVRAIAHVHAAQVATARGRSAAAERHVSAAAQLATPEARWLLEAQNQPRAITPTPSGDAVGTTTIARSASAASARRADGERSHR